AGLVSALTTRPLARAVLTVADGSDGPALPDITNLLESVLDRAVTDVDDTDIWTDFLTRPATYSAMLNELGFITEDEAKMHGDLPDEIVEAVRAKELRQEFLTASLRAYQSFGARFALVQEKVIIGDEMGLGKTIEALAVLAHLREVGHSHFLVVCPAAVVSNWVREIRKHTTLRAMRWHGPEWERNRIARSWQRSGGVAVTTYDLLSWAEKHLQEVDLGCAVFDEAQYIKNPGAKRSQAAVGL
ncbi:MAG: SNF2-related protein, partial [Leptospirillia bacterium]